MYLENYTLQRTNTENLKQIFSEKELLGHRPNFHILMSVSDDIYSHDRSAYSAAGNMWTDPGKIMNRSQTHEATQFSRKRIHKWDFRCSAMCFMFNYTRKSLKLFERKQNLLAPHLFNHKNVIFFRKTIRFIINSLSPPRLRIGNKMCFLIQIRIMIPPLTRYW